MFPDNNDAKDNEKADRLRRKTKENKDDDLEELMSILNNTESKTRELHNTILNIEAWGKTIEDKLSLSLQTKAMTALSKQLGAQTIAIDTQAEQQNKMTKMLTNIEAMMLSGEKDSKMQRKE